MYNNYMEKIRLQKFLSQAGVCSRREAEKLIQAGKVQVSTNSNLRGCGFEVAKIGEKVDPEKDVVKVNGKIIKPQEKYIYYAINKPVGYTSTVRDKYAKKTVLGLVPKSPRVYPVGRLDKNSQGLMILTNDGDLAQRLTHPSFEHQKEYLVKCKNVKLNPRLAITRLKRGVNLYEGLAKFDKIEIEKFDMQKNLIIFKAVLHQGWKRQIRRMCELVGLSVLDLKRIRVVKLELDDLEKGKYKIVQKEDII